MGEVEKKCFITLRCIYLCFYDMDLEKVHLLSMEKIYKNTLAACALSFCLFEMELENWLI